MREVAASLGLATATGVAAGMLSPFVLDLPSQWEMAIGVSIGVAVALVVMFVALVGSTAIGSQQGFQR